MSAPAILKDDAITAARKRLARIGRLLFQRNLTDAAGGNISERVGDVVVMSPSLIGTERQWRLKPEDTLVVDMNRTILVGSGKLTREAHVHFRLHEEFGEHGTGVIHAHARNILVFAALARPIPAILEATRKFGETPVIEYAPAHSPVLADRIIATMKGREDKIRKHAAGTIAPWHGLFLMGKSLNAAFDAVERLDTSAYILLMAQMAGGSPQLEQERQQMETAIAQFTE